MICVHFKSAIIEFLYSHASNMTDCNWGEELLHYVIMFDAVKLVSVPVDRIIQLHEHL